MDSVFLCFQAILSGLPVRIAAREILAPVSDKTVLRMIPAIEPVWGTIYREAISGTEISLVLQRRKQ